MINIFSRFFEYKINFLVLLICWSLSLFEVDVALASPNKYAVIIKGNERIDQRTVKSYLDMDNLKKGNQSIIHSSLKRLYESGLFLEVKIYKQQNLVIVQVKENPIISNVIFQGNKKMEDEVLLAEISLQKRAIYSKAKLQADIKRINNIYIKSGRFLTKIDPKIVKQDQNREVRKKAFKATNDFFKKQRFLKSHRS